MSKLAILRLLDGDLEQGIRVVLTISSLENSVKTESQGIAEEDHLLGTEVSGVLLPNPSFVNTIEQWQTSYRNLGGNRIKPLEITIDASVHKRRLACQKLDRELRSQLNTWLSSSSFSSIRDKWLEELMKDEVRVLVRTSNQSLLKLPWHLWDLVERNPQAEVALSAINSEPIVKSKTPTLRGKVRILAILGNSTGINIAQDRRLLENLTDAETIFLVEPQRREINDQLWDQDWDILYFAGHSRTEGEQGRIYINQTDSLTIAELRYALKKAVEKGLQLAMFNSCDGMGLAFELQQLHLPQVIVMREPVPDEIAQEFLRYFLPGFASGQSLYLAEREARLRLHGREDEFPGASWLPVIFQAPATTPPTWADLGRRSTTLCPYRGLFAFREEDALFFHGRESFTHILIETIQRHNLVSVIGASGSGKSSVVFAGLITQLRQQESWQIAAFRPGQRPFQAIASAWVRLRTPNQPQSDQLLSVLQLAETWRMDEIALHTAVEEAIWESPGTKLLIIVDQFEELYTQCQHVQERQSFIDCLLKVAELTNVALVLTLRTDFLGQALAYPPLADILQQGNRMLGAMSHTELKDAIAQPAALLGVTLEEGLTERMIEAVSNVEGNLPLLEFALQELWEKRQSTQLTHTAYDEIGGLEAAVARYAEQTYNKLSESEKERSRQIFLQLVRPSEGSVDTRRIATNAEIGDHNWTLVTSLASDRLVVTGQDAITKTETVELVHEALISEWSRLRSWIDENRDFRLWQERLRGAVQQWKASDHDKETLLRGKPLVEAENWLRKRPDELAVERVYIEASTVLRQQQRRQSLVKLSVIAAGSFLLTTISGIAWWQKNTSQSITQIRELASSADTLFKAYKEKKDRLEFNEKYPSKDSFLEQKPDLTNQSRDALIAALKAGKALQRADKVDTNTRFQVLTALNQAVYEGTFGQEIKLPECSSRRGPVPVGMTADGKKIACTNYDGTARLLDGISGKKLNVFKGDSEWVNDVRFSLDSKAIAFGTVEGDVKLWDRSTGKVIKTLKGHLSEVNILSFSPSDKTIAAGNLDGTVSLWDISTGQEKTLNGHSDVVQQVIFSPDGQTILSRSKDRTLKLWNSQTGKEIKTLPLKDSSIKTDAYFSADSQTIRYFSEYRTMTIWDIKAERAIKTFKISDKTVLSPDRKIIAFGTGNGGKNTVVLQDLSTGKILKTFSVKSGKLSPDSLKWNKFFRSSPNNISHISFSLDGKLIAVASADHTMTVWNREAGTKLKTFEGLLDWTDSISFSPNGKLIAMAGMDANNRKSSVKLWNVSTGKIIKTLIQEPPSSGMGIGRDIRFSPDSQEIAVASSDSTARLWDISTGKELNIPGISNFSKENQKQFPSKDGKTIFAKNPDGRVKRWDRSTGKELEPLYWHRSLSNTFQFSEDGKTISTVSWDGVVRTRDLSTGKELRSFQLDFFVSTSMDFSDDGSMIAAATNEDIVKLWNVSTGKEIRILKENTKKSSDWAKEGLLFSPNGKTIVAASKNKTVELWDTQTGKAIDTFKAQSTSVNDVIFSPDNQIIAFAKTDGTVQLWDFSTGKQLNTLKQHSNEINSVSFSPDGETLVSLSSTNLKLWNVKMGQEIKTYDPLPADTVGVFFSSGGKTIVLGGSDKLVLWNLDLENLLKRSCDKVRDYPRAKEFCGNSFRFW
jgi:WD40 repeat protein